MHIENNLADSLQWYYLTDNGVRSKLYSELEKRLRGLSGF